VLGAYLKRRQVGREEKGKFGRSSYPVVIMGKEGRDLGKRKKKKAVVSGLHSFLVEGSKRGKKE